MSTPEKDAACGAPTADGAACPRPPFALGKGRCHRHAGLPSTPAERESAARAPLTNGMFAKAFRTKEDLGFYEQAWQGVDPAEVRRSLLAFSMTRLQRVAGWEAGLAEPSPLVLAAVREVRAALADMPAEAPPGHRCLDQGDVLRHVQALVEDEPELFIQRYPPPVQDAIRKAIREGGAAPGA